MLAKLFGEDGNQILIEKTNNTFGNPELAVFFEVGVKAVGNINFTYENSEEGIAERDRTLEKITEEQIRETIKEYKQSIEKALTEEGRPDAAN